MGTIADAKQSLGYSRQSPSQNLLRVASAAKLGELVVFGLLTLECTNGTAVSVPGYIPVDVSAKASLVAASGTLTSDGTNVTDGDTVTIGSTVYRLKTTMAQAYDVQIGADAAATLANLKKAINASGTAGTEYYAGTLIHPTVSAGALTSTTLVVTAKTPGTAGNSLASTEASTHLSWGAATLASGADTSASDYTTALENAVNTLAASQAHAVRLSANFVQFTDNTQTAHVSKTCSETLSGSNNAWAASSSYAGFGRTDDIPAQATFTRTVQAHEVTLGKVLFYCGFIPNVARIAVQGQRSGAVKFFDGVLVVSGRNVTFDNSGSVNWQAGDVITIWASE